MAYQATDVANAIIRLSLAENRPLTNMQIQKLVFLAHGFFLAFQKRPLFHENIKAWKYGPVIPELYDSLRKYGAGMVESEILSPMSEGIPDNSPAMQIIKRVYEVFKGWTGAQLSALTHEKGSPWDITWKRLPWSIISVDEIRNFYERELERI